MTFFTLPSHFVHLLSCTSSIFLRFFYIISYFKSRFVSFNLALNFSSFCFKVITLPSCLINKNAIFVSIQVINPLSWYCFSYIWSRASVHVFLAHRRSRFLPLDFLFVINCTFFSIHCSCFSRFKLFSRFFPTTFISCCFSFFPTTFISCCFCFLPSQQLFAVLLQRTFFIHHLTLQIGRMSHLLWLA